MEPGEWRHGSRGATLIARFLAPRVAALCWLLLAAALTPLLTPWLWPAELLSHASVHLGATAMLVAIGAGALRRPVAATAGALAVLVLLVRVGSAVTAVAAPGSAPMGPDATTLRVLQWNVLHGSGAEAAQVAWLKAQDPPPDLLVLFEVGARFVDAARALAPHYRPIVSLPAEDNFGLLVLARDARARGREVTLDDGPPAALVTPCGGSTAAPALLAVHPPPPLGEFLYRIRARTLAAAADVVRERRAPTVVLGDLNVTPWSPVHRGFLRAAGLRPAHPPWLPPPTWAPAAIPLRLGLPIDLVAVTPGIAVEDQWRGPRLGSDHVALITGLRLPAGGCGEAQPVTLD